MPWALLRASPTSASRGVPRPPGAPRAGSHELVKLSQAQAPPLAVGQGLRSTFPTPGIDPACEDDHTYNPPMKKLLLPLLTALSACASTPADPPPMNSRPPETNRMEVGHLPTPFSAEEIRDACVEGATRDYVLSGENQPPRLRMTFGPDVNGQVVVTTTLTDEEGEVLGASDDPPSTWKAFQAHASFPENATTITSGRHTAAAGTFDCWTYTLSGPSDTVTTFVFARDLPGPPLDLVVTRNGTLIQRMELLDYQPRSR